MTDTIAAGSILVEQGRHLPKTLLLQTESGAEGWAAVQDPRATFETTIREAGLTFFFMAGEIKETVFGFDRQKALRGALKRLIRNVKAQHCNSLEITQVVGKSFLGAPFVSVSGHPRNLQNGNYFSGSGEGSDPELVSQIQSEWKATVL